MCSALATWREPWNMKCSNRCAKPVLPGCSSFEPTAYQRFTAATGATRSGATITRSPLSSRRSSNAIAPRAPVSATPVAEAAHAAEVVEDAQRFVDIEARCVGVERRLVIVLALDPHEPVALGDHRDVD